jgi:hypothetical protein
LAFCSNFSYFLEKLIITLVFEKNAIFCRKLAKIAENCDHNIDPCNTNSKASGIVVGRNVYHEHHVENESRNLKFPASGNSADEEVQDPASAASTAPAGPSRSEPQAEQERRSDPDPEAGNPAELPQKKRSGFALSDLSFEELKLEVWTRVTRLGEFSPNLLIVS